MGLKHRVPVIEFHDACMLTSMGDTSPFNTVLMLLCCDGYWLISRRSFSDFDHRCVEGSYSAPRSCNLLCAGKGCACDEPPAETMRGCSIVTSPEVGVAVELY